MPFLSVLVVAALLGLIPAQVARGKGYSFGQWWLLGTLLLVVALPMALLMKPNPSTRRACPWCRTTIDAQARVCPQCSRDVFEKIAATP